MQGVVYGISVKCCSDDVKSSVKEMYVIYVLVQGNEETFIMGRESV